MSKPQDNFIYAAIYAALFAFLVTAMSLFAKLAADIFPPEQLVFFRSFIAFALLFIGLILTKNLKTLKTKKPGMHLLRAIIGTTGVFAGFWAVTFLPLVVFTTLIFTRPLWVTILAPIFLKEHVGLPRIIAVIAGFIGVLVISSSTLWAIWNDTEITIPLFGLALGLITGLFNALVSICLRWAGKTEAALTTVFYFMLIGASIMACFLPLTGSPIPWDNNSILLILLGLGITGFLAQICQTESYRFGEVSLITPIGYTMIIWAGLFDYILWNTVPGPEVLLGSAIIVGSNVFILWRETRSQKQ